MPEDNGSIVQSLESVAGKATVLGGAFAALGKALPLRDLQQMQSRLYDLGAATGMTSKELERLNSDISRLSRDSQVYSRTTLSQMVTTLKAVNSPLTMQRQEFDRLSAAMTKHVRANAPQYMAQLVQMSQKMPSIAKDLKDMRTDVEALSNVMSVGGVAGMAAYLKALDALGGKADDTSKKIRNLRDFSRELGASLERLTRGITEKLMGSRQAGAAMDLLRAGFRNDMAATPLLGLLGFGSSRILGGYRTSHMAGGGRVSSPRAADQSMSAVILPPTTPWSDPSGAFGASGGGPVYPWDPRTGKRVSPIAAAPSQSLMSSRLGRVGNMEMGRWGTDLAMGAGTTMLAAGIGMGRETTAQQIAGGSMTIAGAGLTGLAIAGPVGGALGALAGSIGEALSAFNELSDAMDENIGVWDRTKTFFSTIFGGDVKGGKMLDRESFRSSQRNTAEFIDYTARLAGKAAGGKDATSRAVAESRFLALAGAGKSVSEIESTMGIKLTSNQRAMVEQAGSDAGYAGRVSAEATRRRGVARDTIREQLELAEARAASPTARMERQIRFGGFTTASTADYSAASEQREKKILEMRQMLKVLGEGNLSDLRQRAEIEQQLVEEEAKHMAAQTMWLRGRQRINAENLQVAQTTLAVYQNTNATFGQRVVAAKDVYALAKNELQIATSIAQVYSRLPKDSTERIAAERAALGARQAEVAAGRAVVIESAKEADLKRAIAEIEAERVTAMSQFYSGGVEAESKILTARTAVLDATLIKETKLRESMKDSVFFNKEDVSTQSEKLKVLEKQREVLTTQRALMQFQMETRMYERQNEILASRRELVMSLRRDTMEAYRLSKDELANSMSILEVRKKEYTAAKAQGMEDEKLHEYRLRMARAAQDVAQKVDYQRRVAVEQFTKSAFGGPSGSTVMSTGLSPFQQYGGAFMEVPGFTGRGGPGAAPSRALQERQMFGRFGGYRSVLESSLEKLVSVMSGGEHRIVLESADGALVAVGKMYADMARK